MNKRAFTGLGLMVVGGLTGCDRATTPQTSKDVSPRVAVARSSAVQTTAPSVPGGAATLMPPEMVTTLQRAGLTTTGFIPKWMRDGGARLWAMRVTRERAVEMWEQFRRGTEESGFYPILFVDDQELLVDTELAGNTPPSECLRIASTIDGSALLAERAKGTLGDGEEEPRTADFTDDDGTDTDADSFVLPRDKYLGKGDWWLPLIPTRLPWETFAYLGYGGWNEYPSCEEHVAVMRYWHERFGAEPVIVSSDCIEMLVTHPPVETQMCRALAMEQFGYTWGDIVYQGIEQFGKFARMLEGRTHWFFWWD